ncbi:phosphodiesterase family protein [Lentilactobacillus parafarraginis F0439]|uniref:Phosphoesterase n=1 Tax=Lentilactobacillus parafarraginis F0439 TaxID=797515 RepID=G9ZT27_9LACO|nr:phosphodiesterase family protein [Lentilactobacillus parafarraginis F0439]
MELVKILVVSDSHGDRQIIADLLSRYVDDVTAICHCGDSELPMNDPLAAKMTIVKGNMDTAPFPNDELVVMGGRRLLVTHGHLQQVNQGLLNLELFAKSRNANVVMFGHTHQLGVTMDQGILFINPGSISQPRGQYAAIGGTYAILTIDGDHYGVDYYNRQFQPVDQLRFRF